MPKPIDLDAVLKKQPQIDPEELKAIRELRERLRKNTGPRQYQLVPPFGGRRVRVRRVDRFNQNPDFPPERDRS